MNNAGMTGALVLICAGLFANAFMGLKVVYDWLKEN